MEMRNAIALEQPQVLLPEMTDVLDYCFIMPKSTMWNLPVLLRLKENIDVGRLAEAVDKVLRHHPAFCTQLFFDEDSEIMQPLCDGAAGCGTADHRAGQAV